jgi:hypothetical protein
VVGKIGQRPVVAGQHTDIDRFGPGFVQSCLSQQVAIERIANT